MSGHRVQFSDLPPTNEGKRSSRTPRSLKGNLKVTNPEDTEHLNCKQPSGGTSSSANGAGGGAHGRSSRVAGPRRHTVGGARSSQEILAMQPSEMDKKREAFLEHLKQKYPHHASAIMGHQERLREQSRSSSVGVVCPNQTPSFSDQLEQGSLASLDALEVMSECDMPVAFTRGSRSRASLPVVRSANLTKDRSLGVLYLQYGDDTKQIRMPNEITSVDTVRAMFVSTFPQHFSMKMLASPSTAFYIKDDTRNVYYELSDIRSITDQSCLKIYYKDPDHAFSPASRPSSGDSRMHRDGIYASRDAPPLMRQPSQGHPPPSTPHPTPPTPHSMPNSPSRIPFGPRSSGGGATMPRERPGHPLVTTPTRSASPSTSAILERRDVKPDEDIASKNAGRPGEGHYSDPFMLHHHPPPPDTIDHGYHRTSMRSYAVSGVPMESVEHHSLFRQKSWKTPPASPHRMGDLRMMEIHASQSQGSMVLERSSPVRQSFRKDIPVAVDKNRNPMGSPVTPDLQSHGPLITSNDPQTRERMRAMEEQIASLTGLVQHALLKGPSNNGGDHENASDRSVKSASPVHSTSSTGGSPLLGPKIVAVPSDSSHASTPPIHSSPVKVNLQQFRRNVSELRVQLQQMRQLQLQNQECVIAQIKQTEQEINAKLTEALRRQEDPTLRQRMLVEEERHKYLTMEEKVLAQLGDLELFVESLKRDPNSATPKVVTLKEVEEGAVSLRKVGESLAGLKGEFPGLQSRMRAVLRVEVEAVKFLKEEPHKLDSMLKRVRTLTDSLSTLRRYATEGLPKSSDSVNTLAVEEIKPAMSTMVSDSATLLESQSSSVRSEDICLTPGLMHRGESSCVPPRQCQQRSPTSELNAKQGNSEKLGSAQLEHTHASSNSSNGVRRNGSSGSGQDRTTSPSLFIEEIVSQSKNKNRATSIEAAEREWEERRQHMGHYNGREFEKMLQEAEANMLKGIPSLEAPDKNDGTLTPAAMPPLTVGDLGEKAKSSEPPLKEDKQPELLISERSTKPGSDQALKTSLEKPTKSAVSERPLKPNLTVKTSMDRAAKPLDKSGKLTQSSEKNNKSPPPPPPRKNYTAPTGMTTTRSGDVIYTSRRESGSSQESDVEAPGSAPQSKPKSSPETKPKPCSPPVVTASAIQEEEDEGDKIMAELQHNSKIQENKDLVLDENGNNTARQSPGVIYYVTAQITKEPDDSTDHRAQSSPSQVSYVNASDKSQNQLHASTDGTYDVPNKDPGTLSSDPPYKPLTLLSSLKSKKTKEVPGSPTQGKIQVVNASDSTDGSCDRSKKGPGMPHNDQTINHLYMSSSLKQAQKDEVLCSPTQGKVQIVKVPLAQVSIEEKVDSPTAVCTPVSLGPNVFSQTTTFTSELNLPNQKLVLSSAKSRDRKYKEVEEDSETFLSPDLPEEEPPPPPPPDNIAFMITNTKVQALSTGEYQELVNAKKGNVQTVTVGSKPQIKSYSNSLGEHDISGFSKKPVIIIFDEPMDIRSAYKRLSTIFECEEELERMLANERIEEESEENEDEENRNVKIQVKQEYDRNSGNTQDGASFASSEVVVAEATSDPKQDIKKKFKLKFPKKQLAALSQAIRAGTKAGKKTLQVVVYEDEEETDGTVKQHKETKRFEIACPKQEASKSDLPTQESQGRTEEIRKSTYKTLDSLEQTIRQLESTISEMGPKPYEDVQPSDNSKTQGKQGREASEKRTLPKPLVPRHSSPRKRPSLQKKPKPHVLPRPPVIPTSGVSITPATQHQVSL